MKMNKFALVSASFFLGAITVISVFALFSFTRGGAPSTAQAGISLVSATDANTLLKAYLTNADTPARPVNGMFLDLQQLNAMNTLAGKNPNLSGFRLYFGREKTGVQVGLVVGVDSHNVDLITNSIYKTDSPKTGPCPPVCDVSSPITKSN